MNADRIVCPKCGTINRILNDRSASKAVCGSCHGHLFDALPVAVDERGFERHIRFNSIPVLLDVGAPWCAPCRTMTPAFEHAAATLEPHVRLLKLNADDAPNVSAQLGIRGIPALYLFRNGNAVAQTAGAMASDAIVRWTQNALTRSV